MRIGRMKRRTVLFCSAIIWVSLGVMLAGCQSLAERNQSTKLEDILRNYEGVIRWGAVGQAKRFYRAEMMEEMAREPSAEMQVTHYEVVQGPTLVEQNKAIQTAIIQYVFVESQVVRELVDQQIWEYDPEEELWYLTSPMPEFK